MTRTEKWKEKRREIQEQIDLFKRVEIRKCGSNWESCDGDCYNCHKYEGTISNKLEDKNG